jgi:Coenzyme PQQ synthesis protein D (PqqD)
MEPLKCYHKNLHIVTTELEDGAILLNLNTKYYYNLNETGLIIWQALDESGDPEAMATKLTDEYDVDREQASACLRDLLEELEKEGLIFEDRKKC